MFGTGLRVGTEIFIQGGVDHVESFVSQKNPMGDLRLHL
jgi:hypothetical protein